MMIKLHLMTRRFLFLTLLLALFSVWAGSYAQAQDVRAMPVTEVEEEFLPHVDDVPIVIELYSSQACIFCPQADRYFAQLIEKPNVIGVACHVDYFDVKKGALSKNFCTARQSWYMEKLRAGPNYTPQIVVNGAYDVVGYKADDLKNALKGAVKQPPEKIDISHDGGDKFILSFPESSKVAPEENDFWIFLYDKPHHITVAEGRNKGQKAAYFNIASKMIGPNISGEARAIKVGLSDMHGGFAIFVQNADSGQIIAAGQYKVP